MDYLNICLTYRHKVSIDENETPNGSAKFDLGPKVKVKSNIVKLKSHVAVCPG